MLLKFRQRYLSTLGLVVTIFSPVFAYSVEYHVIDCPGADAYGTVASAINTAGEITGYCAVGGKDLAFIRLRDGTMQLFSADRAGGYTRPLSINDDGVIAGYWVDLDSHGTVFHGFIFKTGTIAQIVIPGASNTIPLDINSSGTVVGYYDNPYPYTHGFIRDAHGDSFTIDAPNSTFTIITGINDSGETTGYAAIGPVVKGFVRDGAGHMTLFEVPFSFNVHPTAINSSGQVTGWAFNQDYSAKGFTRDAAGTVNTFRAKGSDSGHYSGTFPYSMNDSGELVGVGSTFAGSFGFTKSGDDPPFSFAIPAPSSIITTAYKINSQGVVVGSFGDLSGTHGYYLLSEKSSYLTLAAKN